MDITVPSPITTTARYLLSALGTILATVGVMDDVRWASISGVILALLPIGYAVWKQIAMKKAA